jgi:hypothetical protein
MSDCDVEKMESIMSQPDNRDVLLPCPFCGGEASSDERGIGCTKCRTVHYRGVNESMEIVKYRWNTRFTEAEKTTVDIVELLSDCEKILYTQRRTLCPCGVEGIDQYAIASSKIIDQVNKANSGNT